MPDDSTSKKPLKTPSKEIQQNDTAKDAALAIKNAKKLNDKNQEFGGQEGLDPTRFGDWEKGGRCTDF